MYTFLLVIFILVSILMTVVILLQSSKGGGLAGTFGGSSMGTVFGGRGAATFLSKATTILAVLYLVLAFALSKFQAAGRSESKSLVAKKIQSQTAETPSPASILRPGTVSQPAAGSQAQEQKATTQDTSKK
ncbi:MAG: preprotein translocase subunit SecG [Calditrichaeota bacterium]|nr:MAG: preprotein translocase subunit SecG [Calditrichota bacterium]